jgi:hypothetical protein
MTNKFPYTKFESTIIWNVVNQAVDDLVDNTDIEEKTDRRYIVGYLCKALFEAGAFDLNAETIKKDNS